MTYFYEKIIMSFLFSYKHEIEMERELPMLFAAGFHTMYVSAYKRYKLLSYLHKSLTATCRICKTAKANRLIVMGKTTFTCLFFNIK